jgi:two-component system chemotaxis response regulator CheB
LKIIKVLVVDDSAYNREALSGMLESSPFISVVGTASDGEEAIERVVKLRPDLITLDLEMPRMDGFTFLRWLMKSVPTPVLVISSRDDDRSVIRALEFGAVDFLAKPVGPGESMDALKRDLIEKVKTFAPVEMKKVSSSVALLEEAAKEKPVFRAAREEAPAKSRIDIVAIGASTGGPPAIQAIITRLPKRFPAAVVVSQHMPPNFTRFFAERLDKLSVLEVREARDGDLLKPGTVLISPGGNHMTFGRAEGGVRVALLDVKPSDKYVPSVDMMMKSAASHFGPRTLGVILTGMGNDGKEGMGLIKGMGGPTLAESQETAVIYGMPKEVVAAGVVDKVLPLGKMAEEIIKACG